MRDEGGSVLVIVAVSAVTFMLITAMAIDVGNWFVHKRALQNRVDAAAHAAGLSYGTLFKDCPASATEDKIIAVAKQYAGTGAAPTYNTGINDPNNVNVAVNALNLDEDDGSAGGPCTRHPDGLYWTNVAAREDPVTSFFAGLGVAAPTISANARVALMQADTVSGMRPFGLVDPTASTCVLARFGSADPIELARQGDTDNWTGTAPTNMPPNDISVSVQVGWTGCGSTNTYDAMAYVTRVGGPRPLDDLRVQPTGPTPCPNAYFLPRNGFASCTARVIATLDNPDVPGVRVIVAGNTTNLTRSGNEWSGNITLFRRSGGTDGELPIEVEARSDPPPNTWSNIGRAVVQAGRASDQGPIVNVVLPDYARNAGNTLGNPSITVTLRDRRIQVIDGGVDCQPAGGPDPTSNIQQMFQNGCSGPFAVASTTGTCTMNATPYTCVRGITDGRLSSLNGDYDTLWAPNNCQNNRDRNNWPNVEPGDPHSITVFLTDSIPPVQSENDVYRITGFGGFYVTGWDGDPAACGSSGTNGENDPPPATADDGSVWGHYFKLVLPSADGTPSSVPCTPPTDSAACIAVLVR